MKQNKQELMETAKIIRKDIVEMLTESASGHPGGSLSAADIVTVLYFNEMNIDPKNPKMENRDRFVLSKGHAAPVLYSALARRGFFDPAELMTLRKINSNLQGHPNMNDVPGVDMSTGSLGQGVSTAVGMALGAKINGQKNRVYALLGDGELEEGQVWEAAMAGAQYKLDNLTIFIDFNGLQIDGNIEDVMNPSPIDKKFEAFGWNVLVIDGHNYDEILEAIEKAKACKGKPTAIICKTVKGKGVSFMENQAGWHGAAPNKEQCEQAIAEIGGLK
ncbi:transketolase [Clostridium thermobutyricum]|uniref:transketolase n=1 Tax=Clostridium thermobutyricum TaxID=29372 RepID=UPI002587B8A0|nr:transketolase [Clostridium thermobutyricum]